MAKLRSNLKITGKLDDLSFYKEGWKDNKHPFTFTGLPIDDYLEFTIKTYPKHKGVTNELLHLKINDELILHDVFGAINYKGEGVFIAGGAGVTPFISIFRYLILGALITVIAAGFLSKKNSGDG